LTPDDPIQEPPVLSVVIPTYNGRALLATCLARLDQHRPTQIPLEVIVADDASTDGTPDWVESAFPWVRLVRLSVNGGFCAAANAGIAVARGRFIQLLNNDAEVTAGWAEAGLRPFADPTVGSVAPLVLIRSDPTRVDSAGDGYAWFGWPFKRGHGEPAAHWENQSPGDVLGASGSSAFYRAEALRRVGGFDETFGAYYEDIDLALRLRWAGYRCRFEPSCRILHDVSATYDHGSPQLQRLMARNAELIFWRDLPPGWIAAALLPHLAFTAAQALHRLFEGRCRPFLQGKRDALGELWRRRQMPPPRPTAIARPHFPITVDPRRALRNHLRRPRGPVQPSNRG
jgi:GT2 family glycosyltransferase